jgi:EAL and modified HD-GYP domain-containing signal transduction protein
MPSPKRTGRAAPSHTCFVARQPILDARRQVFGYELLFRSGMEGGYAHGDGTEASIRLIGDTLSVFGFDALTAGRSGFINFTRDVLLGEHAYLLPPRRTVVEVLETVEPDAEVVAACRRLKKAGYLVALDDYAGDLAAEPLFQVADLVKVDFRAATPEGRRLAARRLKPLGIKLLAEKVETWDEFREADELGYDYFQGYFFCRPETLARQGLAPSRANYLRLIEELNKPEIDYNRVERVLKQEAPLALKLLAYLNSSLFGRRNRVTSLKQAAILLGRKNLRRWASITALVGLCDDKPHELLVTAILRGRFCELLGRLTGLDPAGFDPFLAGLLSLIDAVLDRPLEEALTHFAVPAVVRDAVLDGTGPGGQVCRLVRAWEAGDWGQVGEAAAALGVSPADVADAYREALEWSAEATGVLKSA